MDYHDSVIFLLREQEMEADGFSADPFREGAFPWRSWRKASGHGRPERALLWDFLVKGSQSVEGVQHIDRLREYQNPARLQIFVVQ